MKLAAVDIGSNSIHMIIVEMGKDGAFQVVDREKDMVGLGRRSLASNHLDAEAMGRGLAVLRKYRTLAERHGVEETIAVATSAVRESLNGGDFLERVFRETGIRASVITAVEEARLIGLAVRDGIELGQDPVLVVDIGGGSIEMVVLERGELVAADSFKLGVIRLKERFGNPDGRLPLASRRSLEDALDALAGGFLEHVRKQQVRRVVGTSGTILTLGAMTLPEPLPESLNGRQVEIPRLRGLRDRLVTQTSRERARLPLVEERRSDTVAVGAVVLLAIVARARAGELVLCDRALREGLLTDFRERNRERLGRLERVPSLRLRSALELAERCRYDHRHAEQVRRLALRLFDRTRRLHGLGPAERELLDLGALLHDVGTHISFTDHDRHGQYLVRNGELRGFQPEEVELLGMLVLCHRRRSPSHLELTGWPREGRRGLRQLVAILRIADALDRSHFQVVQDIKVSFPRGGVTIAVKAHDDPDLEVWAAARKGRLFEKAFNVALRLTAPAFGLAASPGDP